MSLIHINVQLFIHMTVEFHVFAVINATTMPEMKEARGQNNLFQNASLRRVTVALRLDNF